MQVNQFLELSSEKYPDKKALWYKGQWLTYAQVEMSANKIGNFLNENGIQPGDRVALLYENSFDYVIAYYGILKISAITIPLNTQTTAGILTFLLNHSGAKAIITNEKFSKYLLPIVRNVPTLRSIVIDQEDLATFSTLTGCLVARLKDIYDSFKSTRPCVRNIDVNLASIVYTSGSTGAPKGVMLSHLNIVSNTHSITEYLRLASEDRIMVVLPFYYIYGKSLLNTHFYVGGSVVIDNRFAYPNAILKTMKQTSVTGFSGVPSTYMILLNNSSLRNYRFDSLRYVTQAGGPMAPAIQKEVAEVFKPAKVYIMYGATEASARLSYLDPEKLLDKLGSIGKAIPNVELNVVDDKGKELAPNQIGEIVARGSNLMMGYWDDPDETEKVLKNGIYHTGDLGQMDEEGYLYVVGRIKDMIKVGGERVNAKEIEETILEMNEIREVAVIGVNDPTLCEAIKAIIVPKNGAINLNDIKTYLRKKLAYYKVPKYFEFCQCLPKNGSGKIMKELLRNSTN
jgi:long-chain acyl-CoA synthetase